MENIYKEILEKIEIQNIQTKEKLDFDSILKNNLSQLINKIIDTSLSRYKKDFIVNGIFEENMYLDYLRKLNYFIQINFLEKDILDIEHIIYFHKQLFQIYNEEELINMNIYNIGKLRNKPIMTYNLDENQKLKNRNYFISHNKIEKRLKETIGKYNSSKGDILSIAIFFHECISNIHPFENGNGRVFFIIIDILLIKNNYLPIFIIQDKQKYEIIIQQYFVDRNFNKLIYNFLSFIGEKYKFYQIK